MPSLSSKDASISRTSASTEGDSLPADGGPITSALGAEVIGPPSAGSESPSVDAEVLEMLASLLDKLGIKAWTLELNSVGCAGDRSRYNQALQAALKDVVDKMCPDCRRRAVT